jgi:lipopolysaccharide biosynthesis regulator YciM
VSRLGAALRTLAVAARLRALLGRRGAAPPDDADTREALARARAARAGGRRDEARTLYRHVLARRGGHLEALRELRDLAAEVEDWTEALAVQQRLLAEVPDEARAPETAWLVTRHCELGQRALARGAPAEAAGHYRGALRLDRAFLPAILGLGDAQDAAGDRREAMRTWERAAESQPALPLLARLERGYRDEGRPSRMIALYRSALERAPEDLALAAALGRVYVELEMLDEAAEQFEKLEVRVPDMPVVHAFLGAVFERRGDSRAAFDEYRRALRLARAFDWPHRCEACGRLAPTWEERCAGCGAWSTLRPAGR